MTRREAGDAARRTPFGAQLTPELHEALTRVVSRQLGRYYTTRTERVTRRTRLRAELGK
jgi:hypothetical protein